MRQLAAPAEAIVLCRTRTAPNLLIPGGWLGWPRESISRHPAEEHGAAAARYRQGHELIAVVGAAGENRHRPANLFGDMIHQLMRPSHRPKEGRKRSGGQKSGLQTVRAADDEQGAGNALVTRAAKSRSGPAFGRPTQMSRRRIVFVIGCLSLSGARPAGRCSTFFRDCRTASPRAGRCG
jgi:hypothetical protein